MKVSTAMRPAAPLLTFEDVGNFFVLLFLFEDYLVLTYVRECVHAHARVHVDVYVCACVCIYIHVCVWACPGKCDGCGYTRAQRGRSTCWWFHNAWRVSGCQVTRLCAWRGETFMRLPRSLQLIIREFLNTIFFLKNRRLSEKQVEMSERQPPRREDWWIVVVAPRAMGETGRS